MQKNTVFFVAIAVFIIAVFGIIIWSAQSHVNGGGLLSIDSRIVGDDHVAGATASTSRAALVEYSDLQCPACASYWPLLKNLMNDYGSQVTFVFRYFPLPQHQNAILGATAVEAASKQGKFLEMEDVLYTKQSEWEFAPNARDLVIGYADVLKVNHAQFLKDLDAPETLARVNRNLAEGNEIGINHTPTFFLNGTELENPQSYGEFINILKAATATSTSK